MSKIKEFENIPDIDIEGEETLEEAVADCKALFGKMCIRDSTWTR